MTSLRAWLLVEEPDETEPASFYGLVKWPLRDETYTRGALGLNKGAGVPFLPPESVTSVEVQAQLELMRG